ncbi:hypothetical protein QBC37DRAFT_415995 [Rhypophila decipiens]|uniref:Rhodopsin domain-containing protein n=1 Tax=Rhypophila decipiens TaxID=261697 RepID=A0AAN6YHR7_9PEZI|nr:hypothetical protein QBC37DRAFT_415995 [Rhypophila decipiens]
MDFSHTPGWHGGIEQRLNGSLIALSTIFLGMRLYVRAFMTKAMGWDDLIAGIAWALLVTQSAMDIRAVTFGSGAHMEFVPLELLAKFFESLNIQKCIYFWAVAFVRWSILAFLPRLSSEKIVMYSIYLVGSIIFIQTFVCQVFLLTMCDPVADVFKPPFLPGLNCKSSDEDSKMMRAHGATGIAIDFFLLILPIYIIYSKMMWSRRTIQVILVMSIGTFVVVTGIIRLVLILTIDFYTDTTHKMGTIGVWTNLEGHVGFWCCCFPALQPLVRIISYKLGIRSKLLSGGQSNSNQKYYASGRSQTGGKGTKPGTHHGASANRRSAQFGASNTITKNGYLKNGSGVDNSSDFDSDSQKGIIIADGAQGGANSDIEMGSLGGGAYEKNGSSGAGIHKRTEVSIQTETVPPGSKPRRGGAGVADSWVDLN